jgi:hypothetical protein
MRISKMIVGPIGLLVVSVLLAGCDSGGGGPLKSYYDTCALVSACMADDGEHESFGGQCAMLYLYDRMGDRDRSTDVALTASLLDCVGRARDCAGVRACVQADTEQTAACYGRGDDQICVGDALVECQQDEEAPPDAFDCAAAGLVCGGRDGEADCGESICDPDSDEARCDGELLLECTDSGVWQARDCRYDQSVSCSGSAGGFECSVKAGGTCGSGADGEVTCIGDGASCDEETFETVCEGDVLVSCREGQQARLDCSRLAPELTCGPDAQLEGMSCVVEANGCRVDSYDESCAGGVITFCALGEVASLDCKSKGLSGCSSDTVDGRTVAWCTE